MRLSDDIQVLHIPDRLIGVYDQILIGPFLPLLLPHAVDLLLVVLMQQLFNFVVVVRLAALTQHIVDVNDVVVVVILHQDGLDVLGPALILRLVEVVHHQAEGLLLVVDDVVLLLVVLELFVGQVGEDVQVLVADPLPLLGE